MEKKKKESQFTSVKISKAFLEKALVYHADKNNLEVNEIKTIWFINGLLAKYGAGRLEEISK